MDKKNLKIEDFTKYNFLGAPTFSPDGKRVALIRRMADLENNGYVKAVWVYDTQSKKMDKVADLNDKALYCWDDETHILFAGLYQDQHKATRSNNELITPFYRADVTTGKVEEAFAVAENVTNIQKMGDSTYMVTTWFNAYRPDAENAKTPEEKAKLLEKVNDDLNYEIVDEIPFWWDGLEFTNKRRNRVYIYDSAKNQLTPVTAPLFNTIQARYLADKNQILLAGQEFKDVKLIQNGIYLYDIASAETTCLMQPGILRVYWLDELDGYGIFAASDMKTHGMYENPKFYRVPLAGGEVELQAEYDCSICDMQVTDNKFDGGGTYFAKEGYIWWISTERFDTVLRRMDISGKIEDVIAVRGAVNMFDVKNGKVAHVSMRPLTLQELYIYDVATGSEEQVSSWNEEYLKDKKLAPCNHFLYNARDGFELDGWVLYPVDYEEGKMYPAILDIHGGPPAAYGEVMLHEMQVWANKGYFVMYTNPRGGDGRGSAFMDIRGHWGEVDYTDLMDFTDEVLKRFPMIDVKRLGVTGGSYGGYMTNWIIGHTDRFAAAASQRSVANMISSVGHSGSGYDYTMGEAGINLWEEGAVVEYWQHSPLKYACNAKTPILFIHSDHDRDCFLSEGLQMFTGVKLAGCEAKMCIFKDECHDLSRTGRPKQRIRRLEEITNWFEHYLKAGV